MRIAIVTSGLLPLPAVKGGAIETLVDCLCKENNNSLNLHILSIYDNQIKNYGTSFNNVTYKYFSYTENYFIRIINKIFKQNIAINYFYQKKVARYLNNNKFDYIIIENYPELVMNISNKKVIPFIHSDVFNKEILNNKEILDKCYKVITVSDFIKKRVLEIDKKRTNDIITLKNCIDFKCLSYNDYEKIRSVYRNKYKIKKDDIVYVISGRISIEKGVLEFVKAFVNCNKSNAKLLIIGGVWYGCKKSTPYLDKIKSIANENVIFTGYVNHSELSELYTVGDIGVMPSLCNEAAGLSAMEFLRSRMQVIITNNGGIKEYVPNNGENYIIKYKNLDNLIEQFEKLINEINRVDQSVRESNYDYSLQFTTEKYYNNFLDIVNKWK